MAGAASLSPVPEVNFAGDGPVVLVGRPDALRGDLRLRNDGPRRALLPAGLAAGDDAGSEAPAPVGRLRPVKVPAGETRTVPLTLRMDPTTPPGEYHQTLTVGGLRREAVLRVLERIELGIEPGALRVENRPGQTVRRAVQLVNRGNVPLTLERIDPMVVDDELLDCRILRRALAAVDEETGGLQEFLDELVRQAKRTLDETGLLELVLASGSVTLQPGESAVAELEVRVPSKLDPRARYRGRVGVYGTSLGVTLVPVGDRPAAGRRGNRRSGRSPSTAPGKGRS